MVKDTTAGFSEWDEENLTARLKKEMLASPVVKSKKIDIVRDYYIDDDAILSGTKPAKSARRIDFRFYSKWTFENEYEYFAEAKNLYHADRRRRGDANESKNYYISDGIQRYVSGAYPNGFMLGYVLRGEIESIVSDINQIMDKKIMPPSISIGHITSKSTLHSHPFCYTSTNTMSNGVLELRHIFLKF